MHESVSYGYAFVYVRLSWWKWFIIIKRSAAKIKLMKCIGCAKTRNSQVLKYVLTSPSISVCCMRGGVVWALLLFMHNGFINSTCLKLIWNHVQRNKHTLFKCESLVKVNLTTITTKTWTCKNFIFQAYQIIYWFYLWRVV